MFDIPLICALLRGAPIPDGITADDFNIHSAKVVFSAIKKLADSGQPVDLFLVDELLRKDGIFDGPSNNWIATIGIWMRDTQYAVGNAEIYAQKVRSARVESLIQSAYLRQAPHAEIAALEAKKAEIEGGGRKTDFINAAEAIKNITIPHWLIYKTIEKGSDTALIAPPKSGKSFLVLWWAACVSSGIEWNGRRAKRGKVAYLCGEGFEGVKRRLFALSLVGFDISNIWVLPRPANLNNASASSAAT